MSVSYVLRRKFSLFKILGILISHQRGTEARKILLYKRDCEIAVKKEDESCAVFFRYIFCMSNHLCAYVCCTMYI